METTSQTEHVIVIYKDGDTCRIVPGDTLAAGGDKIAFYNLTEQPVTIRLPNTGVFGKGEFPVAAGAPAAENVSAKAAKGAHVFSAYCDVIQGEAHASIPRIIIYKDAE